MPFVFVHGVNVRKGPDYAQNQALRNGYFRTLVKAVAPSAAARSIENPYWGDHGVRFRWKMAALPTGAYETFGAADTTLRTVIDAIAPSASADGASIILPIARNSLREAVDCLWAAAAVPPLDRGGDADAFAATGVRAAAYAFKNPQPPWLETVQNDDAFIEALIAAVDVNSPETIEAFGPRAALNVLKRSARNVLHAVTSVPVNAIRGSVNAEATRFIGDLLEYVLRRGDPQQPGDIPQIVIEAMHKAHRARHAGDPLVIVAHSMGGNIVYDILTAFAPEITCDVLVTVGSQVALFAEMACFVKNNPDPTPQQPRILKPSNVLHWLNVFDRADVVGYATERVFEGVQDFEVVSSVSPLRAHVAYFERPEFFLSLNARLVQELT